MILYLLFWIYVLNLIFLVQTSSFPINITLMHMLLFLPVHRTPVFLVLSTVKITPIQAAVLDIFVITILPLLLLSLFHLALVPIYSCITVHYCF